MITVALVSLCLAAAAPSSRALLPAGERWAYEIETRRDGVKKVRVELAVHDGRPRQRLVLRIPGSKRLEVEARPRALLAAITSPYGLLHDELSTVHVVVWTALEVEALRGCGAWSGPAWAPGSRCRDAEVVARCAGAEREGVLVRFVTIGGSGSTVEACVARDLALPLAVTVRRERVREPEIEARLAEHGRAPEPGRASLASLRGLWVSPIGPSLLVKEGAVVDVSVDPESRGGAVRYCEKGPILFEWDGELLAVARPFWAGRGIRASLGEELRVQGSGKEARLVGSDPQAPHSLSLSLAGATAPDGPCVPAAARKDEPGTADDLLAAVERDDGDAVRAMLDRGVPADSRGDAKAGVRHQGYTPLQIAVEYELDDIAALLLDRGADPNAGPLRNPTPLLLAVKAGDVELVRLLVARGARWDLGAGSDRHALAAAARDPAVYDALVGAGAPPGYLEMAGAVRQRDLAALRAALAGGRWAEDAFDASVSAGWPEGVRAAAGAGADARAKAGAALRTAARRGEAAMVKLLVELGADLAVEPGALAIFDAIEERRVDAVRALLAGGADLNRTGPGGARPLALAVTAGDLALSEVLLAAGADPKTPIGPGVTAGEEVARMRPDGPGVLVGVCREGRDATLVARVRPQAGEVQPLVAEAPVEALRAFEARKTTREPELAALDAATRREGGLVMRRARGRGDRVPPAEARTERTLARVPTVTPGRVAVVARVPAQCDGRSWDLAADVDLSPAPAHLGQEWAAFCDEVLRQAKRPGHLCGGAGEWWSGGRGPSSIIVTGTPIYGPGSRVRFAVGVLGPKGKIDVAIVPLDSDPAAPAGRPAREEAAPAPGPPERETVLGVGGKVFALLEDGDGLLVGGVLTRGGKQVGLVRLGRDGGIRVLTAVGALEFETQVNDLARDAQGRILAAGLLYTPPEPSPTGNAGTGLVRLLPDGRRESAPGGENAGSSALVHVAEQPGGRLFGVDAQGGAVRLDAQGRWTPLSLPKGVRALDLAPAGDGTLVVAVEQDYATGLLRFGADGAPAPAGEGLVVFRPRGRKHLDLVLEARGEWPVIVGFGEVGAAAFPGGLAVGDAITSVTDQGDPTVSTRGMLVAEVQALLRSGKDSPVTLTVRAAGDAAERRVSLRRIVEATSAALRLGLERVEKPSLRSAQPTPAVLEPLPGGGLLAAIHVPGQPDALLRLRPDGTVDRAFQPPPLDPPREACDRATCTEETRTDWTWRQIVDLAVDARGRTYVAVGGGGYVLRLEADGHVDPSFRAAVSGGHLTRVVVLAGGGVALGGSFERCNGEPARGVALLDERGARVR